MTQTPITLLHCADLHLDAMLGDAGRASQLNELNESERKTLRDAPIFALEKITDIAIENEVDIVVIAGDIFNSRDGVSSDIRTRTAFTNFLRSLDDENIHVAIALGNHDPISSIRELSAPWPESVHIFSSRAPETIRINVKDQEVALHGVSYANSQENRDLASIFPDRLNGIVNIGVLHTNVGGNENHSNYAPSKIETLTGRGYDYFALGHIHKRAVLSDHPKVAYSGNTQGLSAKPSEGEVKGCVIVEIDEPGADVTESFHPTDSVRYASAKIKIPSDVAYDDVVATISSDLKTRFNERAIIYLCRLEVEIPENVFDTDSLMELINEDRINTIVTSLKLTTENQSSNEIFASHPFFEIVESEIENLQIPSLETAYGKKASALSLLLEDQDIDIKNLREEIRQHIQKTYFSRSKAL